MLAKATTYSEVAHQLIGNMKEAGPLPADAQKVPRERRVRGQTCQAESAHAPSLGCGGSASSA